jgi:hypothetical protein
MKGGLKKMNGKISLKTVYEKLAGLLILKIKKTENAKQKGKRNN